ncbi:MAG TPA: class I SAM-dependent methyltransferase, partial [Candidatus Pacearchaeota archaeon]|nr:class I SAM-dependent methyltransferase [Candidatus Pacearchaeota archaeon]
MKPDWGDDLDVRYYVCEKLKQIKNKSVLDIGCGQGYLASFIDQSNNYFGVDTDQEDIKEAKKNNPNKNFECKEFSFDAKRKFDVVLVANIIEVMNNRTEGLKDTICS